MMRPYSSLFASQSPVFANLLSDWKLSDALTSRDWRRFALKYNGPNAHKHGYDKKTWGGLQKVLRSCCTGHREARHKQEFCFFQRILVASAMSAMGRKLTCCRRTARKCQITSRCRWGWKGSELTRYRRLHRRPKKPPRAGAGSTVLFDNEVWIAPHW